MDLVDFLKQNLQTSLRGDAITLSNIYIDGIIGSLDWDKAFKFFNEYEKAFANDPKVLHL